MDATAILDYLLPLQKVARRAEQGQVRLVAAAPGRSHERIDAPLPLHPRLDGAARGPTRDYESSREVAVQFEGGRCCG